MSEMPADSAAQDGAARADAVLAAAGTSELRRIRRALNVLTLLAILTAIYFTRDLLLPIVIAVVLTLTLLPAVRFGERRRVPGPVTAVAVILAMGLGFAGLGYALSGPARTMAADAPRIAGEVQDKLGGVLGRVASLRRSAGEVAGEAPAAGTLIDTDGDGVATTSVVAVVEDGEGGLADQVVAGFASTGGALAVALVLTAFLLAGGDFYHRRIVEAAPRLRDKKQALTIIRDVERQISRYLGAVFAINAALGAVVGLAMWALGMPMAVVWGVLAFLLNFIPFVGSLVNVALVAAVAVATFDTLGQAILPPLALAVLSLLESNVVTPILLGRRLEINTVSQLVAVAFWTWVWGVPGAILAVPFLVVVKAACDNVESLQTLGRFLAGDPGARAGEPLREATGPALGPAPSRIQAEARGDAPPTLAPAATPAAPLAAE